jgi:hypothetical protein
MLGTILIVRIYLSHSHIMYIGIKIFRLIQIQRVEPQSYSGYVVNFIRKYKVWPFFNTKHYIDRTSLGDTFQQYQYRLLLLQ